MDSKIILGLFLVLFTFRIYGQDNEFKFVDESATFQGHDLSYFLENFVIPHIQYPDSAKQNNVQGRVVLYFTVDSIGQVTDLEVLQSLGTLCDQEAMRVIQSSSGMWIPGKVKDKNVKQGFTLAVPFTMKNDK